MPSRSGDGKFDAQEKHVRTNRVAWIQCKRQQDPLATPLISEKLTKVASVMNYL